ncbi:unnamed protein product, partial [marine sediment metagenome]
PVFIVLSFTLYDFGVRHYTEILVRRIYAARKEKDYKAIIKEVDSCSWLSNIDSTTQPLRFFSGYAHLLLRNDDQAFVDLKKAEKAHPYQLNVLMNLGTYYAFQNKLSEARRYYEKVIELHPGLKVAKLKLNQIGARK